MLGQIYIALDRHEEAIPELKAAIAIREQHTDIAHRLVVGQDHDRLSEVYEVLKVSNFDSTCIFQNYGNGLMQ